MMKRVITNALVGLVVGIMAATCISVAHSAGGKGHHMRVLVIGDSISLGAMPFITEELPCVEHAPGNSRDSGYILAHLDEWIANGPYTGYVVNAGLWDIAHLNPIPGNPYNLGDVNQYPVTTNGYGYYENIDTILTRLKQTSASVVWTTTTDVPQGSIGRRAVDVEPYNNIAFVLAKWGHHLPINDVGAAMLDHTDLHVTQPNGNKVHYNAEGYQLVAQVYIDTITRTIGGC